MAGPWERYAQQPAPDAVWPPPPSAAGGPQPAPDGPWARYAQPAAEPAAPPAPTSQGGYNARNYKGSLFPISYDDQGKPSFDSDAGIVGSVKRTLDLFRPGAVGDPADPANTGRIVEGALNLTPVGTAVRAGGRAIPGMVRPPVPSADELLKAGTAGYKASREMGVDIAAAPVADWARTTIRGLDHEERIAAAAPETHKILQQLAGRPPREIDPVTGATIEGFHTVQTIGGMQRKLKEIAGETQSNGKPTVDAGAATKALADLDVFLSNLPPEASLAGSAPAAFAIRKTADADYAAGRRSEDITGREYRADVRAGAANSGQNVGNNLRQRMADILTHRGADRGYSPAEIAALEKIVEGTRPENLLRNVGGALGGGGGWAASVPVAAGALGAMATGHPEVAALSLLPGVGMGLKQWSAALTRGKVHALDEATRARSPLYESRGGPTPAVSNLSPELRTALMRAFMLSRNNQFPQPSEPQNAMFNYGISP